MSATDCGCAASRGAARGRIGQGGEGRAVYAAPETAFVAAFVGENNAIPGRIAAVADGLAAVETPLGRLDARNPKALAPGEAAMLFVRPESLLPGQGAG